MKPVLIKLLSDGARELLSLPMHCVDIPNGQNAMDSQRNVSFLQHWISDSEHKVDALGDEWLLDS